MTLSPTSAYNIPLNTLPLCHDRLQHVHGLDVQRPEQFHRHVTTCCRGWEHTPANARLNVRELTLSIFKPITVVSKSIHALRSDKVRQPGLFVTATTFRHRQASDPRDRLYGFLGMSPELSSPPIDYAKPLDECYTALSAYVLSRASDLDVLNCVLPPANMDLQIQYVGRDEWSVPTPGLPSWCPDWNHQPSFGVGYRIQESRLWFLAFDASGGLPPDIILPGQTPKTGEEVKASQITDYDIFAALKTYKNHVGIGGFHIDTVKIVGTPHDYSAIFRSHVFREWGDLVSAVFPSDAQYPTGQTLERAFQQTLRQAPLITTEIDGEQVILDTGEEDDEVFKKVLEEVALDDIPDNPRDRDPSEPETSADTDDQGLSARQKAIATMCDELGASACAKSFFITEKGYFGMAYSSMREGDGVFILLGERTPYILRRQAGSKPVKKGDEAHLSPHNLISPAFIEGLMRGEALDALAPEGGGMLRYPYITVG
jgi:hypothetical protein